MPKTIRQSVTFNASPHDVYEALMDSQKHTAFTGDRAKISRSVGGKISAYGGYISGVNLELVPDQKIVQSWRASDWPDEHESVVTFVVSPIKGGARLSFSQRNVPDAQYELIKQGWKDFYWEPMKRWIEKNKNGHIKFSSLRNWID